MNAVRTPDAFNCLIEAKCINQSDIISTEDGFFFVNKSLSDIFYLPLLLLPVHHILRSALQIVWSFQVQ